MTLQKPNMYVIWVTKLSLYVQLSENLKTRRKRSALKEAKLIYRPTYAL